MLCEMIRSLDTTDKPKAQKPKPKKEIVRRPCLLEEYEGHRHRYCKARVTKAPRGDPVFRPCGCAQNSEGSRIVNGLEHAELYDELKDTEYCKKHIKKICSEGFLRLGDIRVTGDGSINKSVFKGWEQSLSITEGPLVDTREGVEIIPWLFQGKDAMPDEEPQRYREGSMSEDEEAEEMNEDDLM